MEANYNTPEDKILGINSKEVSNLGKLLLLYLRKRQGEVLSLSALAKVLGAARPSVTVVVGELEKNGYLQIDKSHRDGNIYFLTDKLTTGAKHESRTE